MITYDISVRDHRRNLTKTIRVTGEPVGNLFAARKDGNVWVLDFLPVGYKTAELKRKRDAVNLGLKLSAPEFRRFWISAKRNPEGIRKFKNEIKIAKIVKQAIKDSFGFKASGEDDGLL